MTHKHIVDEVADFVVERDAADLTAGAPADAEAQRTRQHRLRDRCTRRRTHRPHPRTRRAIQRASHRDVHRRWTGLGGPGRILQRSAGALPRLARHLPDTRAGSATLRTTSARSSRWPSTSTPADRTSSLALALAYEIQCRFSAQVPVMARGLNHALQLAMSAARRVGEAARASTSRNGRRHRRVDGRQRVAGRGARRTGVELEGHLAGHHRHARGVHHHAGRSRNHRPQSRFSTGRTGWSNSSTNRSTCDRRPIVDRRRADLPQAVLFPDSRPGHHRRDAGRCATSTRSVGRDVDHVTLEVFQGAYDFAGGGSYGDKDRPDQGAGRLQPEVPHRGRAARRAGRPRTAGDRRVRRADVQDLLARVDVKPAPDLTAAYPERTSARVRVVSAGRADVDPRTVRLRGLADAADVVGPRGREVRLARRAVRRRRASCRHSSPPSAISIGFRSPNWRALLSAVSPTPKRPRTKGRL